MKITTTVFSLLVSVIFFWGCKNSSKSNNAPEAKPLKDIEYLEQGSDITSSAFLALSGELRKAIQGGGLENALVYCNVNALALTDSLSQVYGVEIKRTSLKYRNPSNRPTSDEIEVLNRYQKAMENDGNLYASVNEVDGDMKFYAPIITQDACLKCHGSPSSIPIYDSILKRYPNDRAIDYAMGDLRGIWSVTFRQ